MLGLRAIIYNFIMRIGPAYNLIRIKDPLFIARRLIRMAAEDVGLADRGSPERFG